MNKLIASLVVTPFLSKNPLTVASIISFRSYGCKSTALQHQQGSGSNMQKYSMYARKSELLSHRFQLQQFSELSTMTRIWFKLVIGEEKFSSTSLFMNDDDIISDFRRAVKNEIGPLLNHVASAQLHVYPPETEVPVPADTNPCPVESKVSEHSTTSKSSYLVVAPPQPPSPALEVEELNADTEKRKRDSQQAQDGE
jgi:hypothetical protein